LGFGAIVRKWTGGDEKTGKQAGKKGKRTENKLRRMGLSPPPIPTKIPGYITDTM